MNNDRYIRSSSFLDDLYRNTEKVKLIIEENIIEPTEEKVEKLVENVEVFFHKEKTFGLVFLFIIITILTINLKNE